MNKKFLSAILFGALMVTSTGTFVSCKDYDDDIKDLQEQINSNKDAIAALQKLVGEGKWVTSISSIENGFTITMSDGSTQTVKGINGKDGVDGKNGTEWSIGEDGFWYKDGEKTTSQAIAKDGENGKPGASAPSPSINADGYWVVYEWDATAGEFVAKTTEISAQGTSAYVVQKDGVYELHIADETGKYQSIVLPSTSDSFIVESPYYKVAVECLNALWNPSTTSTNYKALAKAFPEIAAIAKNTKMKQGGELPLLVTPASVDLTEGFTFGLQTLKGMVENVSLSNPTKGLAEDWKIDDTSMSRAASTTDCLWTLQVEPELVDNAYKTVEGVASLVAENAKGTVVKTAFAYTVGVKTASAVTINGAVSGPKTSNVAFAESIDLFATSDKNALAAAPIYFDNEYKGKYIIEFKDQLDVEKYGMELDGHILTIANPGTATSIPVKLAVTALGLNGSTAKVDVTVTVQQEITSTGALSEQAIVLAAQKSAALGDYAQIVKWGMDEFGFTTATQKDAFLRATKSVKITMLNEAGEEVDATNNTTISFTGYKADGTSATTSYADAAFVGFKLESKTLIPGEYYVTLVAEKDGAVIYQTKTTMTVSNPDVKDLFALASAYTADGKVLQAIGAINGNTGNIEYTLENGLVVKDGVSADALVYEAEKAYPYVDMDNAAWLESDGAATWGAANWIDAENGKLVVPTEGNEFDDEGEKKEGKNRMYKERNIRANYTLFGNTKNVIAYDFKVKVMSTVYTADGSNVTANAAKLAVKFAKTIDTRSAISAKYALGTKKGEALNLFTITGGTTPKTYANYASPKTIAGENTEMFAVNSNGRAVEVELNDMATLGFTQAQITEVELGTKKYYIATVAGSGDYSAVTIWSDIFNATVKTYYEEVTDKTDGTKKGWKRKTTTIAEAHKAAVALFEKYAAKIVYLESATVDEPVTAITRSAEITDAKFELVNANDAAKYVTADGDFAENGKLTAKAEDAIDPSNLVEGKAIVNVKMTVTDQWGMKMVKTFNVTVSK